MFCLDVITASVWEYLPSVSYCDSFSKEDTITCRGCILRVFHLILCQGHFVCHTKSLKSQFYGRAVLLSECLEPSEHASLNVTSPISLDISKFPSNNTVNYCFAHKFLCHGLFSQERLQEWSDLGQMDNKLCNESTRRFCGDEIYTTQYESQELLWLLKYR